MVTDQQVRRLFMYKNKETYQYRAADKAGMTERTAYKYIKANKLPSQLKCEHNWGSALLAALRVPPPSRKAAHALH
jgi:hypothetical protein